MEHKHEWQKKTARIDHDEYETWYECSCGANVYGDDMINLLIEADTLRAQLAAAQARIAELEARCAMLSDADGRLQLGSKWLSMRNGSMVVFEGAPYALTSEVLYAGTDIMLALAALE